MSPKPAPYGKWVSPISSDTVVENSIEIPSVFVDPITSSIYHIEARPSDGGRCVIVDTTNGKDVFGPGWSASTRVQEYGGGAATAYRGVIYFSNSKDSRVYKLDVAKGGKPVAVTPEDKKKNHRFADFSVLPSHPHLLVAILEDHTHPLPSEVKTSLVLIDTLTVTVSSVVSGADFYSSFRFSPDGKHAVWKEWDHPDMPWEGAELYVAKVTVSLDGEKVQFGDKTLVSGLKGEVSASYPFWVSEKTVIFSSNKGGNRNPWSYSTHTGKSTPILRTPLEKAFSLPSWFLGGSYGAALDEKGEEVVYSAIQNGRADLYRLNLSSGKIKKIESPYVEIYSVRSIPKVGEVIFVGGQSNRPLEIVSLFFGSPGTPSFETIKSMSTPTTPSFRSRIISVARPITVEAPNGDPIHLNFYPPKNPTYSGGESGEKPPCVFNVHGGPAMRSNRALNWSIQYFTSRGWAWVDVNYRGSSGYGQQYIDRLRGRWGISVTRDCVLSAQHLATALGLVDLSRVFIRGRSAGGYSTMVAISNPPRGTPPDFKWAGATSIYGISNLRAWEDDMHKFQRMYVDWLVGGNPEVYKERSPINHVNEIKTPLLLLHGLKDEVVPPCHSERMYSELKNRHKAVKYIPLQDERHGLTMAVHIKEALEAELSWYEPLIEVPVKSETKP